MKTTIFLLILVTGLAACEKVTLPQTEGERLRHEAFELRRACIHKGGTPLPKNDNENFESCDYRFSFHFPRERN